MLSATAGDGGHDRNDLTTCHRGVKTLQVTHVIVGDEDVHELVQVALLVEQLRRKSRVRSVEFLQNVPKRCPLD